MDILTILSGRVVRNSLFIMVEKIFTIGITAIVGIYVARYLGPEQFGTLNYAISFIGILLPFSRLGLNTIVVRSLVLKEEEESRVLGSTLIIKLFGGVLIVLIVLMIILFSSESYTVSYLLLVISFGGIIHAFDTLDYYFQSKIKSKYTAFARSAGGIVAGIFRLVLILVEAPLEWFAYSYIIDVAIASFGMLLIFQKKYSNIFDWKINWTFSKKILKASAPLMLTGIATSIDLKIDQVMIRYLQDMEQVGQYAAAVRLSALWYFVPLAIMSSYFPKVVDQIKQNTFSPAVTIRVQSIMFYLSITVAIIMTILSDEIVLLLYGEQYIDSSEVLKIHIWSAVFIFIGQLMSKVLVARHQEKFLFYNKLISSSVNVGLNLYLIPHYGIAGAATATLISYGVGHFLVYGIFSKTRDLFFIQIEGMLYPFTMLKKVLNPK